MNANKMKSAQLKMLDNVLSIFKNKETVLDQRQAVKKDVAELKSVREDIATQLKAVKPIRQHTSNKDTCRDKLKKSCAEYAPYLVRLGRDNDHHPSISGQLAPRTESFGGKHRRGFRRGPQGDKGVCVSAHCTVRHCVGSGGKQTAGRR